MFGSSRCRVRRFDSCCVRALALGGFALFAPQTALGQPVPSDGLIDRFQPPPPGEYFAGMPFPRYTGDYPIVVRAGVLFRNTVGTSSPSVPRVARVDWQHVAHPMLFLGVHHSVGAYVGLPVLLRSPTDQGSTSGPTRVGDPRFGMRVRFFQHASRSPVSAHLAAEFFLPARWLNGVRDDVFTGVSDGTVRGNLALLLAGSLALDRGLSIAEARRFIWSGVLEANLRPAANAVRPGSEVHLALGGGVLLPTALHEGWRATLEGHAWWPLGVGSVGRIDPVLEAVLGTAFRLPAEFEVLASASVATGSWADVLVRAGPVFGINVGLAYAIRDWGAFPLVFDGPRRVDPDVHAPRQEPRDVRDFGGDKLWDHDGDGLADAEDPCPSGPRSPQCTETQRALEASALLVRGNRVYPGVAGGLPFTVSFDVQLEVDQRVRLIVPDDAGMGRLARTILERVAARDERFDLLLVVRVAHAERLHPVLRVPGPQRTVWLLDALITQAIARHDADFARRVRMDFLPPEWSSCGLHEQPGLACLPVRFTRASPVASAAPPAPQAVLAASSTSPARSALSPTATPMPPAGSPQITSLRAALRALLPSEWLP